MTGLATHHGNGRPWQIARHITAPQVRDFTNGNNGADWIRSVIFCGFVWRFLG